VFRFFILGHMQITHTTFDKLAAIEIRTPKARMVIVTEIGPRIAHFSAIKGKAGETRNLLFWDAVKKYRRGEWLLRGGHRVWGTRPLADEGEECYAADNAPCKVRALKKSVTVTGPKMEAYGVEKSITVRVVDDYTFEVESTVTNVGDMLWSGGAWALTATKPQKGTTYGIPLGDGTAWDLFAIVVTKSWAGHTTLVNDSQMRLTEDNLIVTPKGREFKRMVQAPQGIIGMTDPVEKVSFLKQSAYDPALRYSMNCNIAIYNGPGNFMTEMETLGAERALRPGETSSIVETWALRDPIDWTKAKNLKL
jgi:hypothetical protein